MALAACVALMVEVPTESGVSTLPTTVATVGLDEVKVHAPEEVEVGGLSAMLSTDPKTTCISGNGDTTGAPPVIVTTAAFITAAQL